MRLFIPEIGTILILAEDWTFKIVNEQRNAGLAKLLNKTGDYYFPFGTEEHGDFDGRNTYYGGRRRPKDAGSYTFPAGTSLEVDRIYIRKGNEDFSSVTFKTRVQSSKLLRFFAKLEDVNRIEL